MRANRFLAGFAVGLMLLAPVQGVGPADLGDAPEELAAPATSALERGHARALASALRSELLALQALLGPAGQAVNPVWLSDDADALLRYIREHLDPATGALRFDGATAGLDVAIARSVLVALLHAQQHEAVLEAVLPGLGRLLAGQVPDEVTVRLPTERDVPAVLAAAASAPGEAAAAAQAVYREVVPQEAQEAVAAAHAKTKETTQQAYAGLPPPARDAAEAALAEMAKRLSKTPKPVPGAAQSVVAALDEYLKAHPAPKPQEEPLPGGPIAWPGDRRFGSLGGGTIEITALETDKEVYPLGEPVVVKVTFFVASAERVDETWCDFKALDPDGVERASGTVFGLGQSGIQSLTWSFTIPQDSKEGEWQIEAVCFLHVHPVHPEPRNSATRTVITTGTDLAIKNQDLKVKILKGTPEDHPTKWEIELQATYTATVKEGSPHCGKTYAVVVEAEGNEAQQSLRTLNCPGGKETLGPLTFEVEKGKEVKVILDASGSIPEANENNNLGAKKFGKAEVLDVFPEWKGGYLAGTGLQKDGADYVPHVYALTKDSELTDEFGQPDEKIEKVKFTLECVRGPFKPIEDKETSDYVPGDKDGEKLFRLQHSMEDVFANEFLLKARGITDLQVETKEKEKKVLFWDFPVLIEWIMTDVLEKTPKELYIGELGPGDPGKKEITWKLNGLDSLSFPLWSSAEGGLNPPLSSGFDDELKVGLDPGLVANVKSTDAQWSISGSATTTFCWNECETRTLPLSGSFVDGKQSPRSWRLVGSLRIPFSFAATATVPVGDVLAKESSGAGTSAVPWLASKLADLHLDFTFRADTMLHFDETRGVEIIEGSGLGFVGDGVTFTPTATAHPGAKLLTEALGKATASFRMESALRYEPVAGQGIVFKGWQGCPGGCGLDLGVRGIFGTLDQTARCCTLIPEFHFPGGTQGSAAPDPGPGALVTTATLRDWLGEGYATFLGGKDGVLVQRVWPGSNPALAARDDERMVVAYSHDDPARPLGRSMDLRYTVWDGAAWRVPKEIERDEVNDLYPELAMGTGDEAAAVWQRMKQPLTQDMSVADMAAKAELAFSRYRFADDTWASPTLLTDNAKPEKYHAIAGDGLGNYLVAWVQDEDGDVYSEANNTLWVRAFLNGQLKDAWKLADVTTSHAPAVALLPGGLALLAWAEDQDQDPGTMDSRVRWVAGLPLLNAWTRPESASNETRHAVEPAVASDHVGRVSLVWVEKVHGTTKETKDRLFDAVMEAKLLSAELGVPPLLPKMGFEGAKEIYRSPLEERLLHPRLHFDAAGRAVLSWLGFGEVDGIRFKLLENNTIVKNIARPGSLFASKPVLLTDDDGGPLLFVAHLRQDSAGLYHIDVPRRSVVADIALTSLAVSPANPRPGASASIEVELENLGDEATGAFNVTLRDNGEVLEVLAVASLAPGASATLDATWDLPGDDHAHTLEAVADEEQNVRDADRSNNAASKRTVLPDPQAEAFHPSATPGFLRLLGAVRNVGARTMPASTAVVEELVGGDVLRGIEPTPVRLGTQALPTLARGERQIVDIVLPATALPKGPHLLRLRAAAGEDFNPEDTSTEATLRMEADLAVRARVEAVADSPSYTLSATVENLGPVAAPPNLMEFREGNPESGALLASLALPGLAPGQKALVNATWTPARSGGHDIFAVASPARALPELDFGNNVGHEFVRVVDAFPDLAVDAGSVFFRPAGIEVTTWNFGDATVSYATTQAFGTASHAALAPQTSSTGFVVERHINFSRLNASSTLRVVADARDHVRELTAANNEVIAPMVAARSATHPNTFDWFPSQVASFEFSALPTFDTVGYSYLVDQQPETVPDTTVDTAFPSASVGPLPPGEHYLHVRAVNASGGATATLHYGFRIQTADALPPVTTLRLLGDNARDDKLYVSARARFALEAFDPSSRDGTSARTGVAASLYSIDGGAPRLYASPFTLTGLPGGTHVVRYWSLDVAGNAEAPKGVEVFLEVPRPPTVDSATSGFVSDLGTLYAGAGARIALSAKDPVDYKTFFPPGFERIEFSSDGGPFQLYAGPIAGVQPGDASGAKHELAFRSFSRSGLFSETKTLSWVAELDAPTAAIPFVSMGPNGVVRQPAQDATVAGVTTFEGIARDATSRVVKAQFSLNGRVLATLDAQGVQEAFPWAVDTRGFNFGNNRVRIDVADVLGHTASSEVNVYAVSTTFAIRRALEENLEQYLPPGASVVQRVVDQASEAVRNATGGKADPALNTAQQAQANAQNTGSGYLVFDSTSLAGPSFAFDDIGATGTRVLLGDEQLSAAIAMPTTRFYGASYNRVHVSSNGWLTFTGAQPAAPQAQVLPDPAPPNNLVAAYWSDLDPSLGGAVHVRVVGSAPLRTTIVQFKDVPHKLDPSKLASFQVRLQETTGAIEVHYLLAPTDGSFHAAGLENPGGTKAAVYKLGSFSLERTAVRYVPHTGLVQG